MILNEVPKCTGFCTFSLVFGRMEHLHDAHLIWVIVLHDHIIITMMIVYMCRCRGQMCQTLMMVSITSVTNTIKPIQTIRDCHHHRHHHHYRHHHHHHHHHMSGRQVVLHHPVNDGRAGDGSLCISSHPWCSAASCRSRLQSRQHQHSYICAHSVA